MSSILLKKKTSNSRRIGKIKTTINKTIPDGWLLCDGSEFSQTDYPLLYEVLGTTTLPNFNNKMSIGTADKEQIGVELAEQLPNIKGSGGTFVMDDNSSFVWSGVFVYESTPRTRSWSGASGNGLRRLNFDASRSNSIWTDDGVVRPNSLQVYFLIKAK